MKNAEICLLLMNRESYNAHPKKNSPHCDAQNNCFNPRPPL